MKKKLSNERLSTIISEAVDIERSFLCDALPVDLIGMNAGLMERYIQFVADRLLTALGAPKMYNVSNPFDWMELLSLQCAPSTADLRAELACWLVPCALALSTATAGSLRLCCVGARQISLRSVWGEYQKAGVMAGLQTATNAMSFDEDF